jgi:hypothetical protein
MAIGAAFLAPATFAEVIEFRDKDEWIIAVGDYTTIDFTGFGEYTIITDQYRDLGIVFTTGYDWINFNSGYLNDGVGLATAAAYTEVVFDTPQAWLAADYPGDIQFNLYSGSELIYTATFYAGGVGNFGGIISNVPFDSVILTRPSYDGAYVDDLYFGVPAPGTLGLLGLFGSLGQRRRRRLIPHPC